MKITHCPPAYATGYAPSVSDLEQLAEDTHSIREAFVPLKLARWASKDYADKFERMMAAKAYCMGSYNEP